MRCSCRMIGSYLFALPLVFAALALGAAGCTVGGAAVGYAIDQSVMQRRVAPDCAMKNVKKGRRIVLHMKSGETVSGTLARIECEPDTTLFLDVSRPVVMPGAYPDAGPRAFPLRDVARVTKATFAFQGVGILLGLTGDILVALLIASLSGVGSVTS